MLLNSISLSVCKFQKDWMKKKIGDGPLKRVNLMLKMEILKYDAKSSI